MVLLALADGRDRECKWELVEDANVVAICGSIRPPSRLISLQSARFSSRISDKIHQEVLKLQYETTSGDKFPPLTDPFLLDWVLMSCV